MKGSFIKNCVVAFSGMKCSFILFTISGLIFTFVGYERVYFWLGSSMFTVSLIISVLEYNDRSRWELYRDTLPVGRKGSVGGLYLFILAYVAGFAVLSSLVGVPAVIVCPEVFEPIGILIAPLVIPIVPLLIFGVLLPVFYRFGYKVFKVAMLICVGAIGGVWGLFIGLAEDEENVVETLNVVNMKDMLISNMTWIVVALTAMLALYFLSMLLSKRIYKNVEL